MSYNSYIEHKSSYIVILLLNFIFNSDSCARGSVKTGKKDSIRLRCCHEELVRIFIGENYLDSPGNSKAKTSLVCANCQSSFPANSGGRCKYCNKVQYCNVACQVCIDLLSSCVFLMLDI